MRCPPKGRSCGPIHSVRERNHVPEPIAGVGIGPPPSHVRDELRYSHVLPVRSLPVMQSHLWRLLSRAGAALVLVPAIAVAQQPQQATTIAGRVTTDAGVPLQGASVTIPTLSVGAYSNQDGRYSFTVPGTRSNGQQVRVTARRIGFRAQAVNLTLSGGTITQDFSLEATPTEISGVVVTALGQSREKSQ